MPTNKCVMHVDDDEAMLKLVSRTLTSRGYEVVSVQDPMLALDALSSCKARVVLLDIDMPGKDGLTLLQEIKNRDGGIQVIMVTGMVSMGTVLRSTTLGAEGCIFKPILDMEQVVEAVERAFLKIHSWWESLHQWMQRKYGAKSLSVLESQAGELGLTVGIDLVPTLNAPVQVG